MSARAGPPGGLINALITKRNDCVGEPELLIAHVDDHLRTLGGGGDPRLRGDHTSRILVGMDELHLEVRGTPKEAGGGFHVDIFVNGVEMTAAGAGLGMDAYDVLIPINRFLPSSTPQRVPIARCTCGVYGCASTDVLITADAATVHWDFRLDAPLERRATFAADAYLREVDRAANDLSWETTERTAGRLVLTAVDRARLRELGLEVRWVANDWQRPGHLLVAMNAGDRYQIFVSFDWATRSPDELASEICHQLAHRRPEEWDAEWHPVHVTDVAPPQAGPRWRRRQIR